jgi:hypothetical protein
MVLLGTKPLGEYPLGGELVQIGGVNTDPYTPTLSFATKEDFKATWGVMDTNYLVYGDGLPISDDPYWNPFNIDPTFYFEFVQSGGYNTAPNYQLSIGLEIGF